MTATDLPALAARIRELSEKATAGDLSTAELTGSELGVECPLCGGEGYVDAESHTNFDGVALGVQFFGIGDHHGAHQELWEFFTKHRATIADALERCGKMEKALRSAIIVFESKEWLGVHLVAQLHHCPYRGPQFDLDEAHAALKDAQP